MMPKMRTELLFAALLGLAVVLGGCASSGESDPAALEGAWVVESFGAASGLTAADPDVTTEMTLEAGEATGSGGVNSFSATYEAPEAGRLSFGPVVSTKIAGPSNAMAQEAAFFLSLERTARFEFNQDKLALADSGNNTLVILAPK